MVRRYFKQQYDIILAETYVVDSAFRQNDSRSSFDHIAMDEIPLVLDQLKGSYETMIAMPIGLGNLPFFLSYLSGLTAHTTIAGIASVGCSLITKVPDSWRAYNQSLLKLQSKGFFSAKHSLAKPYMRHLTNVCKMACCAAIMKESETDTAHSLAM